MKSLKNAKKICQLLSTQKCENLICIDSHQITSTADYFVICTATSTTSVKALADYLEQHQTTDLRVFRKDGLKFGEWAVLDYGDVIVHIFLASVREFYNLEKMLASEKNMINWEK